jgi:hypothetical protein
MGFPIPGRHGGRRYSHPDQGIVDDTRIAAGDLAMQRRSTGTTWGVWTR